MHKLIGRSCYWILGVILLAHGSLAAAPVMEEKVEHADCGFRVVRVAPEKLELVWKDEKGNAYRSFDKSLTNFTAMAWAWMPRVISSLPSPTRTSG